LFFIVASPVIYLFTGLLGITTIALMLVWGWDFFKPSSFLGYIFFTLYLIISIGCGVIVYTFGVLIKRIIGEILGFKFDE
jgi:hypothetical protein